MLQRVIKLVFGRIEREIGRPSIWNLPDPDFPVWAECPTLSDGFFSALGERRIQVRGEIASCDGKLIRFVDGSVSEVDVIVWATGYRPAFPFLDSETLGCEPSALELYGRIAHPTRPGLYFIGFTRVLCSLWPLSEQQAHWRVEVLRGTVQLPSRGVQLRQAVDIARTLPVFCNAYVLDLRRDFR